MTKRRRRSSPAPSSPPPLPPLNPPPPGVPYFYLGDDGIICPADADAALPRDALYWCLSSTSPDWQLVTRGLPPEPSPSFLLDADFTPNDISTHELFASRNLKFAWISLSSPSPIVLPHPDEPGAEFHRLTLNFLAWVRGVGRKAHARGQTLPPDLQRCVDRVWSYVCHRSGITDDDFSRVPAPAEWSEKFPDSA